MLDEQHVLLDAMMSDMQKQKPVYRPGPYWEAKARQAVQAIRINGFSNFRSANSVVGLSYADNPVIYNAPQLSPRRQMIDRLICKLPIIGDILTGQRQLAANLFANVMQYQQYIADNSLEVQRLAREYDLDNATSFGSEQEVVANDKSIPAHYIELCQQLDVVSRHIDLTKVETVFEIGGGFGVMAHIMLRNFPNIKRYIYLDIPPNLFIGTQYLRHLFPYAVRDYTQLKDVKEIHFDEKVDGQTIYCIAPWQIENLKGSIDLFYNSHSFVEMSDEIVANYAHHIEPLTTPHTQMALVTYDGGTHTSLSPELLTNFFPYMTFEKTVHNLVFQPWRKNYFAFGKRKSP